MSNSEWLLGALATMALTVLIVVVTFVLRNPPTGHVKFKTEQVNSLSSLPYAHVKEKGTLREVDKAEGIKVYEYTKGDRVYTVFTSEYDYVNAVREK